MINRGLLHKGLLEARWVSLIYGAGFFLMEMILSQLVPIFAKNFPNAMQIPFIRMTMKSLLGPAVGDQIGIEIVQSILWIHPLVLVLLWGHELTLCTRLPAAEIERGTLSLLLSWPVSRSVIYLTDTLSWLLAGGFTLGMGYVGHLVARQIMEPELRVASGRIVILIICSASLYLAVGCISRLFTSLVQNRSQALGLSLVVVLVSFLINFLAQYWPAAESVSFLSVLTYYRPFYVLRDGVWPLTDLIVLWVTALVCWLGGLIAFCRRDLFPA